MYNKSGAFAMTFKFFLLTVVLLIVVTAAILFGSVWIPPTELIHSPLLRMRLTRVLAGALVGAGLSVSGTVFQAILRNPLADPYVLGVSSGAGLGAALTMAAGLGLWAAWTISAGAFLGALLSIGFVYLIARERSGAVHVYTLLLTGVMYSAFASAGLMIVFILAPNERLPGILWQLLGSLQIYDSRLLWISGAVIVIGILGAVLTAPALNPMILGDDKAHSLGVDANRTRLTAFVLASLIAGACVSLCGLIGFVGLAAPHISRRLFGQDYRRLVPASVLTGAALLIAADLMARSLPLTGAIASEAPVGIVTALIGAPFFLVIMSRRRVNS